MLREAGHILLVARQPCWEVLLGVRLSPKDLGPWDGAEIPLLLVLVAASCRFWPELLGSSCPSWGFNAPIGAAGGGR